ncbi:cysteine desulfurase family protein [Acetohalobium arabaticum]|uniref:Cysteine desulfurase n=1 Tax=Acetohalobium arabaticum (strain ATCC 49924 / DSM 5501 / Z-7288) TaxID=574087 RepID=D9QQK7_ACEAZ|nr:cysteine desulfurase family protein [Acetohalobium arabaticum]ADL12798.1 Cysteine desulfurase [Acetohalobium arabaticum DSM 5501]
MDEVYLDNSATTKPKFEVIEAMMEPLTDVYGNPSSLHSMGVEAEKLIKQARRSLAKVIKADEREIIFTSGGTEANNLAIKGTLNALQRYGNQIITTKVEHSSVLDTLKELEEKGWEVVYLDVDKRGRVDLKQLEEAVSENTVLVSIMQVNSEVGTVQPIAEVEKIINEYRDSRLYLHVDGVQALGKLELDVNRPNIDLLSLSSHKIHGPKGVGALYIDKDIRLKPQLTGGGQEMEYRGGTENVPGIVGFGRAADLIRDGFKEDTFYMKQLKERLAEGIIDNFKGVQINGPEPKDGVSHILNLSFRGLKGEVLIHALEEKNIYASTGSACSSKTPDPSHVLQAMDLDDEAMEGAIRFSLSSENTKKEIDYVIDVLTEVVPELRKIIG